MREIKFRAWNRVGKYYVNNVQDAYDGAGPNGPFDSFGDALDNDSYVVEQFTGLYDNNGREVYEGDVLDIGLQNKDGKPVVAPVSYEKYIAGYVLDNGGNGIWQRLDEDCEVIGNIYENPELLEVN